MSRTTLMIIISILIAMLFVVMGALALVFGQFIIVDRSTAVHTPIPIVQTTATPTLELPTATPTAEATVVTATPTATAVPIVPTATTAPATPIAVLNTPVQFIMARTDVNIRSGPGTGFNVVGWVSEGQIAKVTGVSSGGNWWRVVCPDGSIGSCWVTAGRQYTEPSNGVVTPPTATATSTVCTHSATLVADITVPDGAQFAPNLGFNKTWRIKNNGTCTWDTRYKIVHHAGSVMGAISNSFPLPGIVAPGQSIDLTVSLISPATPGTYQSDWLLETPQGHPFGVGRSSSPFWVKIVVVEQPGSSGSISGFVWQDKNSDSIVNPDETVANITVTLATGSECRTILGSVLSDSNGRFTFTNLAANDYCLYGIEGSTIVGQSGLILLNNQQLTDVRLVWPPFWTR